MGRVMQKKIDVLVLVEHKAREFDAACAIAAHAQDRHGLSVRIVSTGADKKAKFQTYEPLVVVLPWGRFVETNPVPREITNAFPISLFVDLCYEQLGSGGMNLYRAPTGDFAQNQLIHVAWGEFHRDYLRSYGIPDERIVLNGSIPLTLYDEPYRQLCSTRSDLAATHGLDPNKKWVLFNENFFWAFMPDRTIERRYVRKGLTKTDALAFKRYCQDSLRTIIEWIPEIGDNVEFIFRPRPSVEVQWIRDTIAKTLSTWPQTLKVIKHGTVREWVLASDVIMSSHSTTLLDASYAGKPSFAITPISLDSPMLAYEWLKLVSHLHTKAQFLDAISKPAGVADPKSQADLVSAYAHTGRDAFIGAADLLEELARGVREHGRKPYFVPEPAPTALDRLRKIEKSVKSLLPFRRAKPVPRPEFSDEDAARRVGEIRTLFGNTVSEGPAHARRAGNSVIAV